MDSGDFIKHTEPPLFGISKLLQTTVCNTHVIERCILYRGSLICTPLFTPYALCCGLYTALSPFSYSYLRKSESHSQAGSTSGLYNKKYAPYRSHKFCFGFFSGIFSGIFCDLQKISLIFTLIFAIRKIYRKYLR